jgi:hypothetical protein
MANKKIEKLIEALKKDYPNSTLLLKPSKANKDDTAVEGSWKASVFPHTDVPKGFHLIVRGEDEVDRTALEVMDRLNNKPVSFSRCVVVFVCEPLRRILKICHPLYADRGLGRGGEEEAGGLSPGHPSH